MRKIVAVLILAVMLSGCSGGVKTSPGVYEPAQSVYDAYDVTVLSGKQAATLTRFKESLAIVVVKGDTNYVFGDPTKVVSALGITSTAESYDQERLINRDGIYHSLVLRDMNNEVIGIQLTERDNDSFAEY